MTFSDMEDLITISFPVYNVASTIERSLMSALNQTYSNIEYLIVDDCGSDNSMDILKNILHNTSRKDQVKIIRHSSNKGLGAVRNTSIENASGKYIYFMDSDDVLAADALECCYRKCEEEDLNAVIFEAEVLTEDKETRFSFNYHYKDLEDRVYGGIELMNFLLDTNQFCVSPCMLLLRASLLKRWSPVFYLSLIHI